MDLLLGLTWFTLYMLSAIAISSGSIVSGVALGILATAAAYANRRYRGGTRHAYKAVDVHHETDVDHYYHDPVHRHYGRPDGY